MKIELMGWGSEKSHNSTRVFDSKKLSNPTIVINNKTIKVNTCNRCGKEIPKRWRYCKTCKRRQANDNQKQWRKNSKHKKSVM